jgi:hypothetical protein
VLVVLSPQGSKSSSGLFLEAAAAELEVRTNLTLRSPEQVGLNLEVLEACPAAERYGCWVKAVPEGPRWLGLVFVTDRPGGKGPALATIWLELEAAKKIAAGPTPDAAKVEAREQALYALAIETPRVQLSTSGAPALRGYFAALYDGPLAAPLKASGHQQESGSLQVRTEEPELPVRVDGFEVGRTSAGQLDLRGIRVGAHRVELPGRPGQEVQVDRGGLVTVSFGKEPSPPHPARPIARISALVLAGAGLAVLTIGAAYASADTAGCLVAAGASADACPGPILVGTGADAGSSPQDPRGLRAGPGYLALGLGLGAAAGGLAYGSTLGLEEDPPWWALILGLGLGVVSYGVVTVLGGD